jgi:hypothetical protein
VEVSAENRVSLAGVNTYDSVDGQIRFQLVDGRWHRFDLSYSTSSPIDGPDNGFRSLDEVVRAATAQSAVIV